MIHHTRVKSTIGAHMAECPTCGWNGVIHGTWVPAERERIEHERDHEREEHHAAERYDEQQREANLEQLNAGEVYLGWDGGLHPTDDLPDGFRP